jgi:hypothetical protein
MRRRDELEGALLAKEEERILFAGAAPADRAEREGSVEDLHKYVGPIDRPPEKISPSLAEGSTTLNKNMSIYLKEREWNSLDRHVKALGRNKSEWVRYALLKLMQEEQIYCFKHRKR